MRAERVVVHAWIGAGLERRVIQAVAPEHRDRAEVAPTIDRMLQPRCCDAINNNADLAVRTASHREVAAKIVDCGDARHGMDCRQPVRIDWSAGVLKGAAIQRCFRGADGRCGVAPGADGHVIGIGRGRRCRRRWRDRAVRVSPGDSVRRGRREPGGVGTDDENDPTRSGLRAEAVGRQDLVELLSRIRGPRLGHDAHTRRDDFGTEDDPQTVALQEVEGVVAADGPEGCAIRPRPRLHSIGAGQPRWRRAAYYMILTRL